MYLGFFVKIYILPEKLTYVYISPISIGPLILMYGVELFKEWLKDLSNWSKNEKYFDNQMKKHDLKFITFAQRSQEPKAIHHEET